MTNTNDDMVKKISRMLEIGGTMLAQHCDICGAPMFRYQGKIMCPVCESVEDPRAKMQQKMENEAIPVNEAAPVTAGVSSAGSEMDEIRVQATMEDTVKTDVPLQRTEPKITEKKSREYPAGRSVSSSATELESLLMKKMISLANSMNSEDDVRKISDQMDMIERCLSIIDKMKKTL